jgi:serine/threonine protein kinase
MITLTRLSYQIVHTLDGWLIKPMIADFGISLNEADPRLINPTHYRGACTDGYRAPESYERNAPNSSQIGNPFMEPNCKERIDDRLTICQIGCIIWAMIDPLHSNRACPTGRLYLDLIPDASAAERDQKGYAFDRDGFFQRENLRSYEMRYSKELLYVLREMLMYDPKTRRNLAQIEITRRVKFWYMQTLRGMQAKEPLAAPEDGRREIFKEALQKADEVFEDERRAVEGVSGRQSRQK